MTASVRAVVAFPSVGEDDGCGFGVVPGTLQAYSKGWERGLVQLAL